MKCRWLCVLLLLPLVSRAAQEVTAEIGQVSLFKNGLALVERRLELPGPGEYALTEVPIPVHGTFWLECSAAGVTARTDEYEVEEPVPLRGGDLAEELNGRQVTLTLRNGDTFSGTVQKAPPPEQPPVYTRNYQQPNHYWHFSYGRLHNTQIQTLPQGRFLVLRGEDGLTYLGRSDIARVSVPDGPAATRTVKKPALLLTVPEGAAAKVQVTISYLAKGLSWAPAYRLELGDDGKLALVQQAVLRNEMEDFENAQVRLISGFPHIEFSHVDSPMALSTNWTTFFQALSTPPGQRGGHAAAAQQMVMYNAMPQQNVAPVFNAPDEEGAADIHYQPIGRHSLAVGQSLLVNVANGQAAYEKVVEWLVEDPRDARGHYRNRHHQNQFQEAEHGWDALRFRNPLAMPMTTAPAMILGAGQFLGQSLSGWVNPGQETLLRITKALSVAVRSSEKELPGQREIVYIGGNDFRQTQVEGTFELTNHRAEKVKIVVRRQFSGELLEADDNPASELRQEGVYSVNPRRELTWTFELGPGKSKTLTYKYSVLVDN